MDDLFRKIQGLLAKAEGTDNENEASAFYAKAQELMLRYAIDEARVREAMGQSRGSAKPEMINYEYSSSDSNARGKANLLHVIARANRVRMLNYANKRNTNQRLFGATTVASQWCALVGYKADIEYVKMLYTSLLIQSARLGSTAWKHRKLSLGVEKGQSAFMTAYLQGFSETIRQRFAEQGRGQIAADQNALVVRVEQDVTDAFRSFFPHTKSVGFSSRSAAGMAAGRADGHKADIGNPGIHAGALRLGSGR